MAPRLLPKFQRTIANYFILVAAATDLADRYNPWIWSVYAYDDNGQNSNGDESAVSFSYDPSSPYGPANWETLPMEHNQCGGTRNSPIAFQSTLSRGCTRSDTYKLTAGNCTMDDWNFDLSSNSVVATVVADASSSTACQPNELRISGLGASVRYDDDDDDIVYVAHQFHIHACSEHTLDGKVYDAELHIVHRIATATAIVDNVLAVIGIWIEASSSYKGNDLMGRLLDQWMQVAAETAASCQANDDHEIHSAASLSSSSSSSLFNVYDLLDADPSFFHYNGSLTTPPCTETVDWNVAHKPLRISTEQRDRLMSLILNYRAPSPDCTLASVASMEAGGSTARPVQPWNGRTVEYICPVDEGSRWFMTSPALLLSAFLVLVVITAVWGADRLRHRSHHWRVVHGVTWFNAVSVNHYGPINHAIDDSLVDKLR